QQRPKVNPRRQRRTPVLLRIKLRAPLLDKLVEALGLQQLIQTLIKRMSRRRRQLGVRDPDVLLLLPLLARPHRHAPILRTKSVDTSELFVYESGLAPRAAKSCHRRKTFAYHRKNDCLATRDFRLQWTSSAVLSWNRSGSFQRFTHELRSLRTLP